ncbi:MAG: hypothetical protein QQN63_00500 [Nitrosopumilus sp.]
MKYLLLMLLLVTPLSAQDRVFRVSDTTFISVNVNDNDTTVINVLTGELAAAQQSLANAISNMPVPVSQSGWSKAYQVAIVGLIGWGIWEFKKWADKWEPSSVEQNNTVEHGKSDKSDKSGRS